MQIVDRVIETYGGAAALARRLGISRNAVSDWRSKQRVPVERVLDIEKLTGIPRYEIRPDIYPPPSQTTEAAHEAA
jgi:DNA-binding transcriptional regulator YdaS (Cro superfamily)